MKKIAFLFALVVLVYVFAFAGDALHNTIVDDIARVNAKGWVLLGVVSAAASCIVFFAALGEEEVSALWACASMASYVFALLSGPGPYPWEWLNGWTFILVVGLIPAGTWLLPASWKE
ncbi:MAG: hypothetical protein KBD24_01230 [Candidatus Pacebacteria bacterium]|nr:hypothetical protein [Candidatus Paceibacterota bacterium]